jgi:hypothetical protein
MSETPAERAHRLNKSRGLDGLFGPQHQAEPDVPLAVSRSTSRGDDEAESQSWQESIEDEILNAYGLRRDQIESIKTNGSATQIFLKEPARGGYNEIRDVHNGAVSYIRDGKLHNTDGYALDWRTGTDDPTYLEVHVAGARMYPPDESGFQFQESVEISNTGRMRSYWRAGDNRSASVDSSGEMRFYYDGQLDRVGAPAVIFPDGTEAWFRYGKEIENPYPVAPNEMPVGGNHRGYNQFHGANYQDGRNAKDVAKDLREDFKKAKYAGVLPSGAEIKVTVTRAANSVSMNVAVSGIRASDYLNPDRDEPGQPWRTADGQKLYDYIEQVGNSYNRWQTGSEASISETAFYLSTAVETKGN